MEQYSFLAMWLFVFVIHAVCANGNQESVSINSVYELGDNDAGNRDPVRDVAHEYLVVTNQTDWESECRGSSNNIPHSFRAHEKLKRVKKSGFNYEEQIKELKKAVQKAKDAEDKYIAEQDEDRTLREYNAREERTDAERTAIEEDDAFRRAGGSEEAIRRRQDQRAQWWAMWDANEITVNQARNNEIQEDTRRLRDVYIRAVARLGAAENMRDRLMLVHGAEL